jgi:hypothetical protein
VPERGGRGVTADDVRRVATCLPRTQEALVRDRVKFRVGRIVYIALSRDETLMGFAYPKEERAALVAAEPDKFLMPVRSDERYNWVRVRLSAIDQTELGELVVEAWRMVVPKGLRPASQPLMVPGRTASTRQRSIIELTWSGTSSWWKCPAPTVRPTTSVGHRVLSRARSAFGVPASMYRNGVRQSPAAAAVSKPKNPFCHADSTTCRGTRPIWSRIQPQRCGSSAAPKNREKYSRTAGR